MSRIETQRLLKKIRHFTVSQKFQLNDFSAMEPHKLFADLDSPTLDVMESAKTELLRAVAKTKESWLVRKLVYFSFV